MSFKKIGELTDINLSDIQDFDSVSPIVDEKIIETFAKMAHGLKRIAPKADDFLYFSAVMMHAAEASLVNHDGTPKLNVKGEPVKASWDKRGGSWRWDCNDASIKPYKNSNGDIFPEEELVKAYLKWKEKPLCIDHKSQSVDHVRGIIVDTYYDRSLKRVIALCALDKKNYPDLAQKVASGVSNCVSMGTAVGKAICSDCGTVAKTEADFCKCMRNRTCYGEINVDLNPIELSIVVTGADPQAKIKHIIAAANSLNAYVERKDAEIKKLARMFSATLNFSNEASETTSPASGSVSLQATDLETLKKDVEKAFSDFEKINSSINEENLNSDTNHSASNQSGSTVAMAGTDLESTDFSLAPPSQKFASEDLEQLNETLASVRSTIESKLLSMQTGLDKLANHINIQEEIMSGKNTKNAYFQGAGDVNEPTPGKPRYAVDPLNEQLREEQAKKTEGEDMGPIDGIHPGDLEKKKLLARATAEERAMRRNALAGKAKEALALKKESYYGGTTEPTPGKKQYPADPLNEKLREDGDKHMEGQKPFPDSGKLDGLHPSPDSADQKDELKRKELLLRAGLKARFIKASKADGSHDLKNSAWEVFLGDKLLLTASVDDISGGRAESHYSSIATKAFGQNLISNVKISGAESVKAMFKKADEAAPPPAAPPALPEASSPAGDAVDEGKEGDPKATAMELAEKVRDLGSDLVEAVRALTGEQAEMGELGGMPDAAPAEDGKVSVAALNNMRVELNGALLAACKEAIASLGDHEGELNQIVSLYDNDLVNSSNRDFIESVSEDSFASAKESVADAFKLVGAFVKYARGTQAIVKRAQEEAKLNKKANGDQMVGEQDSLMAMVGETGKEVDALTDSFDAPKGDSDDSLYAMLAEDLGEDDNDAIAVENAQMAAEVAAKAPNAEVTVGKVASSLLSKAGRAAARAKLASEMKFHPMLDDAHDKADVTLPDTGNSSEAQFEGIVSQHDALYDLAKAPPKVRKEAEAINRLVSEGKLDPADFPALIANGLDSEAVSYWKKYFGQTDGGSEFASELVKEHAKAQAEEDQVKYKVKIARAYEIAYDMVERELLSRDRGAVSNQVDEIMKWNDESIESFKRVIAKQAPSMHKAAGRMPQVGLLGSGDVSSNEGGEDLYSQLSAALSKSSKRSF